MSGLPLEQLEQLVQGHHWDPLAILGAHPMAQGRFPYCCDSLFLAGSQRRCLTPQ